MAVARLRRNLARFAAGLALVFSAFAVTPAYAMASPRLKPPPPGPQYANRQDLVYLAEIQKAIERRDFLTARALADRISTPMARSLGHWFYFYAEDPQVRLLEADAFLDAHPEFPAIAKIQSHAEKRISLNTPARTILDFYQSRDPVTGEGMLALARAEFDVGKREAGEAYVKEAWKRYNFTLQDEQRLLANYGKYLSVDDHIARADRLLWAREATAARRVIPRLPSSDRRKAEARAAFILGAANAPTLFYSLPEAERLDPGVLLAAVRYFRRTDEEPRAVTLAMQAPTDPALLRNASRWWEERQLLMRWALEERRYEDAYVMAAGHGLDPGQQFSEAEFNAGWIALRFLNAPERAEIHFAALAGTVGAPISVSRAYYWLGRAAEARGAKDLAAIRYREAAKHIYTFYGQLAAERLGADAVNATNFAQPVTSTPEDLARFASRPSVHALRILTDLGDAKTFLTFSYHLDDQLETAGEYAALADLADRVGATHVKVRAGKVGVGRNAFVGDAVYPVIDVPDRARRYVPAEMVLGLSRQESEFNPRAFSSAGARGLMQLLPSTAEITAKKEGLKYSRTALLDDPEYNMTLGAAHLSHLLARYSQSQIMTFAAYNAGPNRVTQWMEKFGDPRSGAVDPVDWIELIPFQETRNYVQRVLENTQIYRGRLSEAPIAGRLSADIERGGSSKRAGLLPARQYAGTLPPLPERTRKMASDAKVEEPAAPEEGAPSGAASAPAEISALAPAEHTLTAADEADFIGDAPKKLAASKKGPRPRLEPRQEPREPAPNVQPPASEKPADKTTGDQAASAPAGRPASNIVLPAAGSADADHIVAAPTTTKTPSPPAAQGPSSEPLKMAPVYAPDEAPAPPPSTAMPSAVEQPSSPGASAAADPCMTYRDFVAKSGNTEASAADLNAGMLAEATSGGAACGETKTP